MAETTVKFGGNAQGAVQAVEDLGTHVKGLIGTVGEELARAFGKSEAGSAALQVQASVLRTRISEVNSEMNKLSATMLKGGEGAAQAKTQLLVLGAELSTLKTKMAEVNEQSDRMGSLRNIVSLGPKGVSFRLKEYASALSAFGAALTAVFAGEMVIENINKISEMGEKLLNLSDATGVSVRTLSDWHFAATRMGIQADSVDTSLARLAKNIQEAIASPSSTAAQSFNNLGMSQDYLKKNSGDLEAVYRRIADAVQKAGANGVTAADAMRVLGDRSGETTALLAKGSGYLDEMAAKNRELGGEIDHVTATQMAEYNAAVRDLSQAWEGFSIQLATLAIPHLIDLMHVIEEVMADVKQLMDLRPSSDSFIGKLMTGAGSAAKYLPYPLNMVGFAAGALTQKPGAERAGASVGGALGGELGKESRGNQPPNMIPSDAFTQFEADISAMQAKWTALGRSKQAILAETVKEYQHELDTAKLTDDQHIQAEKALADAEKSLAAQTYSDKLRTFENSLAKMQADELAAGKSRAQIAQDTAAMWQKEISSGTLSQDEVLEATRTMEEARRTAAQETQQQNVTLAKDSAETEIRIEDEKLAATKSRLTQQLNESQITSDQWLASLKEATEQASEIEQAALAKELDGLKGLPEQYQAVYDQILELKQKLTTQLAALDEQASQKAKQEAQAEAQAWKSAIDEITSAETKFAQDMLTGKRQQEIYYPGGPGTVGKLQTLGTGQMAMQSLENISSGLISKEMTSDLKFYSEKMFSSMLNIPGPKGGGGLLATGLGKLFGGGQTKTPEDTLMTAGTSLNTAGVTLKAAATQLSTAATAMGGKAPAGTLSELGETAGGGPNAASLTEAEAVTGITPTTGAAASAAAPSTSSGAGGMLSSIFSTLTSPFSAIGKLFGMGGATGGLAGAAGAVTGAGGAASSAVATTTLTTAATTLLSSGTSLIAAATALTSAATALAASGASSGAGSAAGAAAGLAGGAGDLGAVSGLAGLGGSGFGSEIMDVAPLAMAFLDEGAWQVPKKMPAMLHPDEMVVPAGPATAIRKSGGQISTSVGGGGVNNSRSIGSLNFNGPLVQMNGGSPHTPGSIADMVYSALRNFNPSVMALLNQAG